MRVRTEEAARPRRELENGMVVLHDVPRLDARCCSAQEVRDVYDRVQVLLLEHVHDEDGESYGLAHLRQLFARHEDAVVRSWTAEGASTPTPEELLGSSVRSDSWYSSMVLDERCAPEALAEVLAACPRTTPALSLLRAKPHAWLFFGSNRLQKPMTGRPEHRDNVQSDGTWHVQLCGSKMWRLRPYPDPFDWEPSEPPDVPSGFLCVLVKAGSALLVNTRLYLHETSIPGPQPGVGALSMSLARDFSCSGTQQSLSAYGSGAATDEADELVRGQEEFSSVLCTVQLCAWCGTPCSRDAFGVCGCLCCTLRRRSGRGGDSVTRHSRVENGLPVEGARQALPGAVVQRRGLTSFQYFVPSIDLAVASDRERIMPWQTRQDSLQLVQGRGASRFARLWKVRDDNATKMVAHDDDDAHDGGHNTRVFYIRVS